MSEKILKSNVLMTTKLFVYTRVVTWPVWVLSGQQLALFAGPRDSSHTQLYHTYIMSSHNLIMIHESSLNFSTSSYSSMRCVDAKPAVRWEGS